MAHINWTRLLIILLTILVATILASIALWTAAHFSAEILLLFSAAIVAYLLAPLVDAVQRATRSPRPLCILAIYLIGGLIVVGLGALFVPPIEEQARAFEVALPGLLKQLDVRSATIELFLRAHGIALPLRGVAGNAAGAISGASPTVLGSVLMLLGSIGTGMLNIVLVAVVAFYMVNDRESMARGIASLVPERYTPGATFAARSAGTIIGRYVRAQLAVALMVAVLGGGGAAVLGVKYAPLIGVFAFLAESIPVLGPIIATVPAVLLAVLDSPWKAIAVLVWFIIVQQLEQNVIMPRLSGHAVGIHPVAAIMAVLIGFDVGSIWGALFAVPVLGFCVALVREALRVYRMPPVPEPEIQQDESVLAETLASRLR